MEVWELATDLRKEAERLERLMSHSNRDPEKVKEDIIGHIIELEAHIDDIKREIGE